MKKPQTLLHFSLLGFVFTQAIAQQYSNTFDSCFTPRQEPGSCIVIRHCKPLFNILQHHPLTPQDSDYLKQSQCGFEGLDPKVCCPVGNSGNGGGYTTDNPPIRTTIRTPSPTIVPTKPSGSSVNSDLLPSLKTCGTNADNRIVGGEVAELDEFPWMTLIEYQKPNGKGFYCGGALISQRYVLTAAHCVKGKDLPRNWKLSGVRLGEYDTDTPIDCMEIHGQKDCADEPQDIPVEDRIAHEDYDPYDVNQYHDIALLRLARNIRYTDFIKPICLPTAGEQLNRNYEGSGMTVAGWGKTENRSESNIKLKLQVPVKPNQQCASVYSTARVNLGKGQLCAGGEAKKDSCRGDSGGPLMVLEQSEAGTNWFASGVVSFGPSPCGMEGWPGVYTRVSEYMPWILKTIKP